MLGTILNVIDASTDFSSSFNDTENMICMAGDREAESLHLWTDNSLIISITVLSVKAAQMFSPVEHLGCFQYTIRG